MKLKHGDLFIAQKQFYVTAELSSLSSLSTMKVFHANLADDDSPYDYFTVPQCSVGIFLESNHGMHKVLFPEYGVGWVWEE